MGTNGHAELAEWLAAEMKRRGLSNRELGQMAGIAHSSVARALDPQGVVSFDVCSKLARALNANPVTVLELAGLLSRTHPTIAEERDLVFQFRKLTGEQKDQALRYLRFLAKE
ncbi:MAG: hypothetical protein IPM39_29360 [Chloroflexi bacterium]|nr:hypothetical protein [Chloroflexota bacterium]